MAEEKQLPKHVAIIPDGNRRWAKARGLPTFEGHKKGFDVVVDIAKTARQLGIHTLTLWAFSTENWNRSKEEVDYLMELYERMIDQNLAEAKKDEVKIVHLGRKDRIPESLRKKIEKAENETKDLTKYVFNVALDYGGHDDILRAVTQIAYDVKEGKITPEKISEPDGLYQGKYPEYYFKNYLDTKNQPNPYVDFCIRTSGEQRVSGFLSWQLAYAEFYFPTYHFPDFSPEKFKEAIDIFMGRDRRFGGNQAGVTYVAK